MARKASFQWTKARSDELKKELANFTRRVRTAEKSGRIGSMATPTFSMLKGSITSTSEYKSMIRSLKAARYETLKPGKSGETIWQEREQKRAASNLKRKAKRQQRLEQLKEADLSLTTGRLPTSRDYMIMNINRTKGTDALDKLQNWLTGKNLAQSERWRENYLKAISHNRDYAMLAGETDQIENLTELYNKIQKMDLIDFLIGQIADGNELAIGYLLDSPTRRNDISEGQGGNIERLLDLWSKYG